MKHEFNDKTKTFSKKTDEVKLMIIENFIDYFTSNEDEREQMYASARDYVAEDHVDEITQSFPELKNKNVKTFGELK